MYYSFKIRSHWACSPHRQMFKMFSWLGGTQVLKTAEQWLSALKEKMGFQLISQMANLSCTRERILQFNINIELNGPICKKEHRLNLECFCLVFRGSNLVEVSSPGFHETLEALLQIL